MYVLFSSWVSGPVGAACGALQPTPKKLEMKASNLTERINNSFCLLDPPEISSKILPKSFQNPPELGGQKWGGALNNKKNKSISRMALPPAGRTIHVFFDFESNSYFLFIFCKQSKNRSQQKKIRIFKNRFTKRCFAKNAKLETSWRSQSLSLEPF